MKLSNIIKTELKRAADDFLFHKGRCLVWAIVASTTSNPGSVAIYDGIDTNGNLVMTINLVQYATIPITPSRPFVFNRGIYVNCDAATTTVTFDIDSLPD